MTNQAAVSQLPVLAVVDDTLDAPSARVSQAPLLAVNSGVSNPRVSQVPVLVVYNEGATEDLSIRAWSFFLDGNWFYVLHLGEQGTWVYSVTADNWYEWQTEGYSNWNAEQGLVWDSRIVVGDSQSGILWEVDPETQLDEGFRPIRHKATGILSTDDRTTVCVDGMWITASVGFPTGDNPTFSFRFSDDQGVTWTAMPQVTVNMQSGNYTQEIAFRSLGSFQAPGRVFEISDVGGSVRIDRVYLEKH